MWSYYGAKTNIIHLYPPPKYGRIIEPFAGTARYSLLYWDRDILLVDKYEVIVKIWKWLQQCSKDDVLRLPRKVTTKQSINDFTFDCEEARLLFSFLLGQGAERPRNHASPRVVQRQNFINFSLIRISEQLHKIRHWDIRLGSYDELMNEEATWFIDPPYQYGGQSYVKSNRHIDFKYLAEWCRYRKGQVIVCENTKADWMDFKPMIAQMGSRYTTIEAIWCNYPTSFDVIQQDLFNP